MNKKKDYILKFVGSTYYGGLDFSEQKIEELEEEGYGEEKIDEILTKTWEEYTKDLNEIVKETIKESKLPEVWEKYGIRFEDAEFIRPKTYNYSNDSAKIEFNYNLEEIIKVVEEELKEEIKDYMKNERKRTTDGYLSNEPESYKELVDVLKGESRFNWNVFYAIFWAIEKKEEMEGEWEDVKYMIRDKAQENYYQILIKHLH